ncbi:hypothetical protein GQ457_17G027370 [Hibiscus cannabinus]
MGMGMGIGSVLVQNPPTRTLTRSKIPLQGSLNLFKMQQETPFQQDYGVLVFESVFINMNSRSITHSNRSVA